MRRRVISVLLWASVATLFLMSALDASAGKPGVPEIVGTWHSPEAGAVLKFDDDGRTAHGGQALGGMLVEGRYYIFKGGVLKTEFRPFPLHCFCNEGPFSFEGEHTLVLGDPTSPDATRFKRVTADDPATDDSDLLLTGH